MKGEDTRSAKEITEVLFNATGKAILSGDFEAIADRVSFPLLFSSSDNKIVLETASDLKEAFVVLVKGYHANKITELTRHCEVAEYQSTTRIEAMHIMHTMAGDRRVGDQIPILSTLDLIDGQWKISSSQYAADETSIIGQALLTLRHDR